MNPIENFWRRVG